MQNAQTSRPSVHALSPILLLLFSVIALSLAALLALPTASQAQVSISLGVQELYDDNVFLEDGNRRPSFVIVDDQFEMDFEDGEVPTVLSDELDGLENDDFITNLTLSLAGASPYLQQYMQNRFQLGVGAILFSEFDSQNRLTLDGLLETSVSKLILPDPYYLSISNQFSSSASDNVSFAEGTASRSTQTYSLLGRLGVADVGLARNLAWGLGYTGSYHVFLGELRFEDTAPGEFEEEGSDYHTHVAGTNLRYQVSPAWTVSIEGEAGVQLFTNVETNDIDRETRESSDLDRANYTGRGRLRYSPNPSFQSSAFAGVTTSDYLDEPEAREVTVVTEDGETQTVLIEREDSEASLIFGADASYTFAPGTQFIVGIDQNVGTDIDGDRITSRSVYSNAAIGLTDRLALNLGARFLQYSSSDELQNATERYELSSSFSFLLTQQASLSIGYNFADQQVDDELDEGALFTRSEEYTVNRAFIAINVGILGLPG